MSLTNVPKLIIITETEKANNIVYFSIKDTEISLFRLFYLGFIVIFLYNSLSKIIINSLNY